MVDLFKLSPATTKVSARGGENSGRHILIIVQNLPVPLDRRVWLECQTLVDEGFEVSVICPKGPHDPAREVIDGVHIYKYRPSPRADGIAGFVLEFAYSWLRTGLLSLVVWRDRPFSVMQACNPPDTYWLLALLWRARRVKFVFDQHDLNPELYLSRFGEPQTASGRAQLRGLLWLEQMTYRTAAAVISTNESYKSIALTRGRRRDADVTVVRSGPDTEVMRPIYVGNATADSALEQPTYRLVYLGIMGPQDGVDVVLRVMHELVNERGRRDLRATLMGFGDCYDELRQLSADLGLDDLVTFTGRVNCDEIAEHLSTGDIGLCPDLKSPLNDVSTMNKTMEYMAYALPSVAFDLTETRVSGGDAVIYVPSGDLRGFADAIEKLLDDDDLRCSMGRAARQRVANELDWRQQAVKYAQVYHRLTGHPVAEAELSASVQVGPTEERDVRGRRYVDLSNADEFDRYIRRRQV